MSVSAVDAVNPAFQHAKKHLFQPFRFSQWWRFALVGLLAGEMGSSGGCSFNFNGPSTDHPKGSEHFFHTSLPPIFAHHPAMLYVSIAFLVMASLGLLVLFLYISSVTRFILFEGVVTGECYIRKGWLRWRRQGRLLFEWQFLLALASLAAFGTLIASALALAWERGWLAKPGEHVLPLVLGGGILLMLLLALAFAFGVVQVMTKDFVVPQMALGDVNAAEGWRRLWPCLRAEKVGYAGYIGMKIVLAIGASIVLGMVTLFVFLILLIPIGGVGVIAVIGAKAAGWSWTLYTIALAVIAGVMALMVLFFAASLISVPATVFFPAYSMFFFAPRYPALAAVLWPRPPAVPGPTSSPATPPPPIA